jgi:hypothetical protein
VQELTSLPLGQQPQLPVAEAVSSASPQQPQVPLEALVASVRSKTPAHLVITTAQPAECLGRRTSPQQGSVLAEGAALSLEAAIQPQPPQEEASARPTILRVVFLVVEQPPTMPNVKELQVCHFQLSLRKKRTLARQITSKASASCSHTKSSRSR